ncbi:hypothetical protein DICVIV_13582 [Dictyocaulus viviparus]|uniref:Uncharacterized protein n=1 Tax=Dictyocaulus viviparus TaxID=29172 RepID=A0A0D8X9L2_DICVI|nr:hypothetical protein DICVIV_13582 [Dictyocaulus viviparus]
MKIKVDRHRFKSATLQLHLEAVRHALQAVLCLEQFSSQVVERHMKSEVRLKYDVPSKELLMTPVVVARKKQERVLIEPAINSVRMEIVRKLLIFVNNSFLTVSISIKQSDDIERISVINLHDLCVNGQIASSFCDANLCKEISDMKLALNARARVSAEEFLKRFN